MTERGTTHVRVIIDDAAFRASLARVTEVMERAAAQIMRSPSAQTMLRLAKLYDELHAAPPRPRPRRAGRKPMRRHR